MVQPCVLPRIEKKELRPLDEAETKMFLDAIKGHQFESLYTFVLFSGLREGEALGLTWDRVDFIRGTILISKQLQKEKRPRGDFRLVSVKNGILLSAAFQIPLNKYPFQQNGAELR